VFDADIVRHFNGGLFADTDVIDLTWDEIEELIKILDPACGSGNFLYVAINLLLDLEKQVIAFASTYNISLLPHVRPTQLLGIEINPFAQELAQVVIWIGYLQWMQQNGFIAPSDPVGALLVNARARDRCQRNVRCTSRIA